MLKRKNILSLILIAVVMGSALAGYTDETNGPGRTEIFNKHIPGTQPDQGTWVLGAVQAGSVELMYGPVFMETFDNYLPGPLAGQGTWVWNSSAWGGEHSPTVSSGHDKYLSGDITRNGGTAASCFFPNIFANGNSAGRIEFDFRRGILELDFLVGPASADNEVSSNNGNQSVGGQFSCYNGGCFTPKYHGGYNNPQIIYRLWQPGTSYHLTMDLVKTGEVVTVTTTVDGIPLSNLSGIVFTNTAPEGINSLMIRGADYINPTYAVDNIKVSVPFKQGGISLFPQ